MKNLPIMSEPIPMQLQVAENFPSLSFVSSAAGKVQKSFDALCSVDVIHSGHLVPPDFYNRFAQDEVGLVEAYNRERDWGADFVAHALVTQLGLSGYYRVNTARVFVEVGRFPKPFYRRPRLTPLDQPFNRIAFTEPYSARLNESEREAALMAYYDPVCEVMESLVTSKQVKVAIHTYDPKNQSGTPRPDISLLHIPKDYQDQSCLPEGAFDPLFPQHLAQSTASPRLVYSLALRLLDGGLETFTNLPYTLPAGSIEVRANVWAYVQHLQCAYQRVYPVTQDDPAHQQIWQMLGNTNARRASTHQLRHYLHNGNGTTDGYHPNLRQVYANIQQFAQDNHHTLIENYQHDHKRPNLLAIEVRKDLLFKDYKANFGKLTHDHVNWDKIDQIASLLAKGIQKYLTDTNKG